MPFLKPSPERLGLRGTEVWWRTTTKTFIGMVATAVTLMALPDVAAYANRARAAFTANTSDRQIECYTPDLLRTEITMRGLHAVSARVITPNDLCVGVNPDSIDPALLDGTAGAPEDARLKVR